MAGAPWFELLPVPLPLPFAATHLTCYEGFHISPSEIALVMKDPFSNPFFGRVFVPLPLEGLAPMLVNLALFLHPFAP